MLRATRVLFSAVAPVAVKKTTGIVGLEVVPDARIVLTRLYEKTLTDIKILPETAAYRKSVEKFTSYRLNVVKTTEDVFDIETKIASGQVEELIEQAKSELQLIPQYADWKLAERKRPTPDDDEFQDLYDELENIEPGSVAELGLKDNAAKKRAEAETRRKLAAQAQAAAAAAADAANVAGTAAPKK